MNERNRTLERHAQTYTKIIEERAKGAKTPVLIYERCRGDAGSLIIDSSAAYDAGIVTDIIPVEGFIVADDENISIAP